MTRSESKSAAMELNPRDREVLAEELLLSLSECDRAGIEAAWGAEAMRRSAKYDAGESRTTDADVVIARLRAKGAR